MPDHPHRIAISSGNLEKLNIIRQPHFNDSTQKSFHDLYLLVYFLFSLYLFKHVLTFLAKFSFLCFLFFVLFLPLFSSLLSVSLSNTACRHLSIRLNLIHSVTLRVVSKRADKVEQKKVFYDVYQMPKSGHLTSTTPTIA